MKTPRSLVAAACAVFLALTSSAQHAKVLGGGYAIPTPTKTSSIYGSAPEAWGGVIGGNPSLLSGGIGKSMLAPIVMNLESQNIIPQAFALLDAQAQKKLMDSAVPAAKQLVLEEARGLIGQIESLKTGTEEASMAAAKLAMLSQTLGSYLPQEELGRVQEAYARAQAKLSEGQREKLGVLMRKIADGLTSRTLVEALGEGGNVVQAGAVDENSFARKKARLTPSVRGGLETFHVAPVPHPDVLTFAPYPRPLDMWLTSKAKIIDPTLAERVPRRNILEDIPLASLAAQQSMAGLRILTGKWRRVSGNGYDLIDVTALKDKVQVRDSHGYGYDFSSINGPRVDDPLWRGSWAAPGGTVSRETTTRFENGKLESRSVRTETHLLAIPNQLRERHSFEIRDGRLIEETESVLYRKAFFYFGPYNARTRINTTNLVDPDRPTRTTVYERVGAEP